MDRSTDDRSIDNPARSDAAGEDGARVLPPLAAVLELAIFFGVVAVLEWVLQTTGDIQELTPHPFWLPVLLLSLQYGTVSGLLAAFCSIVMSYALGWPEQDVNENHFTYLVRIWTQPVLWISAALLLGQFRTRQIAERAELHRRVEELDGQRRRISEHADALRSRCENLERSIAAAADRSPDAVLAAFEALGRRDEAGLTERFGHAARLLLGPSAQCSLFARTEDGLRLAASVNWQTGERRRTSYPPGDPLHQAIVREMTPLSVLEEHGERALGGQGLLAVPVLSQDEAAAIGMLKVELLEPAALDAGAVARLQVLARQLARGMDRVEGPRGDPQRRQSEGHGDGERVKVLASIRRSEPVR